MDLKEHWSNVDKISKVVELMSSEPREIESLLIRGRYLKWICWFRHQWIALIAEGDPRFCPRCGRFEYLKPEAVDTIPPLSEV